MKCNNQWVWWPLKVGRPWGKKRLKTWQYENQKKTSLHVLSIFEFLIMKLYNSNSKMDCFASQKTAWRLGPYGWWVMPTIFLVKQKGSVILPLLVFLKVLTLPLLSLFFLFFPMKWTHLFPSKQGMVPTITLKEDKCACPQNKLFVQKHESWVYGI